MSATRFIERLMQDITLQNSFNEELLRRKILSFAVWQTIAQQAGFQFTEAELDAVFEAQPALMDALEQVIQSDLVGETDFELNASELAVIAAGGGDGSSTRPLTEEEMEQFNGIFSLDKD